MITATEALNRLIDQNELFYDEMTDLMRQIMTGQLQPEIIAALLIGLRIKVETVSEIAAAATVMRDFATKGFAYGLVAQTHAQQGDFARKMLDGCQGNAGLLWRARARAYQ